MHRRLQCDAVDLSCGLSIVVINIIVIVIVLIMINQVLSNA